MKARRLLPVILSLLLIGFIPRVVVSAHHEGIIKWLQDISRDIQTIQESLKHEQSRRMKLEESLQQLIWRGDSSNIRHINELRKQMVNIETRLQRQERALENLAKMVIKK